MKSFLLAAIMAVLMAGSAGADSLRCDPQEGVVLYNLKVNGVLWAENYLAEPDGSIDINIDSLADGTMHVFEAQAIDASGWGSGWSNPFDARKPGAPGGVIISQ